MHGSGRTNTFQQLLDTVLPRQAQADGFHLPDSTDYLPDDTNHHANNGPSSDDTNHHANTGPSSDDTNHHANTRSSSDHTNYHTNTGSSSNHTNHHTNAGSSSDNTDSHSAAARVQCDVRRTGRRPQRVSSLCS
jgi:hypothetical protein